MRLSPLRIRHARARMNFELLNMNAIDHDEDILDEHVSLRTRHSSINFAEITLARRTRLFFFDALPSVEMKFAKQQFSALGPIRDYCFKSNAKMKTTSEFSE